MSRIALVGNLTIDRVSGGPPRPGGGVFHGARAAAHVGADAVVATRCAPDDRELVLAPLEAFGLPVTCADASETTAFSFSYDGDHRVMEVDALGEAWSVADLEGWAASTIADASWVHVAGLLRSHFPAAAIEYLARGRRLLLDAQGILRQPRLGALERDAEIDRALLRHLAVLKLNEDEGRILAGGVEPDQLRALGVPEVVLTLGSDGALVITPSEAVEIPPAPTRGEVDPTGAGDAFSVVYLAGRARELEPAEAATHAAAVVAELIETG